MSKTFVSRRNKMVDSVKITNFKAIKNIELDLSRFNIFVGSNNSGKSSVLQAIQFAVGAAQTGRKFARDLEKEVISFSANPTAFAYLPLSDIEALVHDRNLTQTQGSSISFTEGEDVATIILKRGKNRNISTTLNNSQLLRKLMSASPYCVITPGISGISISEEFKTKAVVFKSATRGDSNFYLRNILLILFRKPESWEKFITKFHEFFPDYTLNVEFDEESDDTIEVSADLPNGVNLPIDALGTSALQILQIISYIYCFDPQMLILDEPDTHLHPNNQRKLISVLNDISSEEQIQILLSTHSRHMIDEAINFSTLFWMQGGELYKKISVDDDADYSQILLDLGAFDKSDFLKNDHIQWVICTEDARVEREEMLKSILKSSGFDLSTCIILPYKGCSKIENVILLFDFVRQYAPAVNMIVHRDRDYLDDEKIERFSKQLEDKRILFWHTPGTDVESIFVNADHIYSVYPELTQETIQRFIQESKDESAETSISKFVNYTANETGERDFRQINLDCEAKYTANPDRYFYGKKTLGILKAKIQRVLHKNPKIFVESPAIAQAKLQGFLEIDN